MKGAFMRKLLVLTLLMLGATAARAENGLFYLGVGAARHSVSDFTNGAPELRDTSWKAYAGVRPLNWLAVEADYIDLGSAISPLNAGPFGGTGSASISGYTWGAYAVGFLPIPLPTVDIFGKAGVALSRFDSWIYVPGAGHGGASNGTGFAWGAGVQAHIKIVGARLEYEDLKIPNSSGAKVASLSVFLNF
jgi:opacity protein-like surface antigen